MVVHVSLLLENWNACHVVSHNLYLNRSQEEVGVLVDRRNWRLGTHCRKSQDAVWLTKRGCRRFAEDGKNPYVSAVGSRNDWSWKVVLRLSALL